MAINQRKIGALLQYVQMFLSLLVSLIYTPILIRTLGQGEYGIYSLAASIISYLSLFSFGFTASYIRFYTRYKVENDSDGIARLNGMFMIIFVIIGFVALGSGLALAFNVKAFFSQEGYTDNDLYIAKILMILLSVNLALSFPTSVFTSYISSQEKFIFQKLLNIGKTIISPMISIPLLFLGYGSIGVVLVTTIVSIVLDIINAVYCLFNLKMKFSFKHLNIRLLKEIANFSVFIAINQIVDQVNLNINNVVLAKIISKEAVAIYAVALTINTMYISLSTAISGVFVPYIHRIIAVGGETRDDDLTALFIRVGRIQYGLIMLILTGFIFFGKYFIDIWAGPGYEEAYYIALILLCPSTVPLIQNVAIEIQRAENKHRFRSLVLLAMAMINIVASILLCMKLGVIGASIGTAISVVVANIIILNIYYAKALKINILKFWLNILRMSIGLLIPVAAGVCIKIFVSYNNIFEFIGWIALYSVIYVISIWFLGMNKYEKNLVIIPLKKITRRLCRER